jgi:transcriptional regulator with XRE-family HTH domain
MRGITSLSSLGSSIRGERMRAGLTQAELASKAGMNRATVISVESGSRFDIATLFALVKALGLELSLTPLPDPAGSIFDETDEL